MENNNFIDMYSASNESRPAICAGHAKQVNLIDLLYKDIGILRVQRQMLPHIDSTKLE
jgi:hypothetical protein